MNTVLEKGRVAERGTHQQLWAADSRYAALIRTGDDVAGDSAPDQV